MTGDFNSWGQEKVHIGDRVGTDFPKSPRTWAGTNKGQYPGMERPWCSLGMRFTTVGRRTRPERRTGDSLGQEVRLSVTR